jgi:hypothetical protein
MPMSLFLENKVGGVERTFYAIYIACKGDWPWIRKAYGLHTGFSSNRKCHICTGADSSQC